MAATAQLNVGHGRLTTAGERHNAMEFQKASFGTASLFSAKRILPAIARPLQRPVRARIAAPIVQFVGVVGTVLTPSSSS